MQILGGSGLIALAGCAGGQGDGGDDSGTTTSGGDGGDGGDSGDGGDGGDGASKDGGELTFAQVKSPIEFDPIVLNDVPSSEVSTMVFDSLYSYGEGTDIEPLIAAEMPEVSQGGQRYVVPIREEATFQTGDPVTAEDVKYSFEAPVAEDTENAGEFSMIDTVSVVDESTVQFDLKFPFGAFTSYLPWSIVPKSVREEDKQAFNTESPVGAGPFQFEDWTEGDFVRVTRWDDYWGEDLMADGLPHLDSIEFVPVEEGTTRVTTLRSEENDIIKEIPPKSWTTVENIDGASIDSSPGINYFYLAFNCKQGPTSDPRVREAIDYTFSMDQAVSNFVEPTGIRQYSPIPRQLAQEWGFPLEEWQDIPHSKDIEQAQQLFDEAGVPQDYEWNIIVPPDDKREQIGVTVANGLGEAGFSNTSVQRLDWGAFLDKYVTGNANDYNMYTLGWAGSPDPDSFMYFLFSRTEDTLGVTNGTFFGDNSDAGVQAADKIVQARESVERSARKQLYEEAVTTILEQRAHLPAYGLKNSYGVQGYVNDFSSHPVDGHSIYGSWNNTWLDN